MSFPYTKRFMGSADSWETESQTARLESELGGFSDHDTEVLSSQIRSLAQRKESRAEQPSSDPPKTDVSGLAPLITGGAVLDPLVGAAVFIGFVFFAWLTKRES
jgi:hypothetical protein